jgi:hypothetical protein
VNRRFAILALVAVASVPLGVSGCHPQLLERSPIVALDAHVEPTVFQRFQDAVSQWAQQNGFAFKIGHFPRSSRDTAFELSRPDIEIWIANPFEDREFRVYFYKPWTPRLAASDAEILRIRDALAAEIAKSGATVSVRPVSP